ncbi:hypothetical protein BT63DRAFT_207086 [Microthyrium microscopicum]|uniref:COP9 signalosome complex subunit 3 N-terminal helical repeats domain-containing protein n=1 Tax=Microthyrium microscopicum TaxID=703497 RepID=A0A6A6UFL3_9PEZI|nr:hypothetical protein BT63DRAFT_207086 [Microthyrium microscopicum]
MAQSPTFQGSSASEYDKQIRQFRSNIKRLSAKDFQKRSVEDILGEEDQAAGTGIEYTILLSDTIAAVSQNNAVGIHSTLWAKILQYLRSFDPVAIRYVGKDFRMILETVISSAKAASTPHHAIIPVRNAILRLQPENETLTSFHLPLLQLCLETKHYQEALPILDKIIFNFPTSNPHNLDSDYPCSDHQDSSGYITLKSGLTSPVQYRNIHEYFLLGGMIYTALGRKRWDEAMLYFEYVMCVATQNVATGYMLEAYRKWLLLGVLLTGKTPAIPRIANSAAMRTIQTASKHYVALVAAFHNSDVSKLKAEINVGLTQWDEDGNLGLALELTSAHRRFYIINLQKTYSRCYISQLDEEGNSDLAMKVAHTLIEDGNLNAVIEYHNGKPTIEFFPNSKGPLAKSEEQFQESVVQKLDKIKALMERVKRVEQKVMLSPEYIQAARKAKDTSNVVASGPPIRDLGAMDEPMGFSANGADFAPDDEDLMET